MDIFEKQQRVEAIKGIIKIRWVNVTILVVLGLFLKTSYFGGWGDAWDYFKIIGTGFFAFGYNFAYWLFLRRPAESIGSIALNIVTAMQVVMDQLMFTFLYYYAGTVEGMNVLLYFLIILIASSLYKTKGIILTSIFSVLLYLGATLADFYRVIPHVYSFPGEIGWFGHIFMTRVKIASLIFYMGMAVFFSAFLSHFIRIREKALREKSERLNKQTQFLTLQTQELTQTKDYLHEALVKSDKARVELVRTKEELEKANLELTAKIEELEKYGRVTVGREIKMAELKEKIKTLESRVGELEQQIAPQ